MSRHSSIVGAPLDAMCSRPTHVGSLCKGRHGRQSALRKFSIIAQAITLTLSGCESRKVIRTTRALQQGGYSTTEAGHITRRDSAIEFSEVGSQPLSRFASPLGVTSLSAGKVLLWSSSYPNLTLVRNQTVTSTYAPSRTVLSAYQIDDSSIAVLGKSSGRVEELTVTFSGRTTSRRRVSFGIRAESATRHSGSWYVVGRQPNGRLGVARIDSTSRIVHTFSDTVNKSHAYIVSGARGLTISLSRWPFESYSLTESGVLLLKTSPFLGVDSLAGVPSADWSNWIGLPRLSIGDHLIQTLADPHSTRRIVAVTDPLGRSLRGILLNVPLSFIGVDRERSEILALRTTDQIELVRYRWRVFAPRDAVTQ